MQGYDNRNIKASSYSTKCVVDGSAHFAHPLGVLTVDQFLAEIRRRAPSDAAVGRALGLPSSRIAELFSGKRRLQYEEARTLAEAFQLDGTNSGVNAATLTTILTACLRNAPSGGWTADDAPRLARAVEHALELLASGPANRSSEDAIAMAGHAASLQLLEQHREA